MSWILLSRCNLPLLTITYSFKKHFHHESHHTMISPTTKCQWYHLHHRQGYIVLFISLSTLTFCFRFCALNAPNGKLPLNATEVHGSPIGSYVKKKKRLHFFVQDASALESSLLCISVQKKKSIPMHTIQIYIIMDAVPVCIGTHSLRPSYPIRGQNQLRMDL